MARSKPAARAAKHEPSLDSEESHSLLSEDSDLVVVLPRPSPHGSPDPVPLAALQPRRQSSFAQPRPDGAPRTPNRVQFDDAPVIRTLSPRNSTSWMEEDDYLGQHSDGRRGEGMRLLTDMEAPSVRVASADIGFNAEDLLESARPKSGMQSAFMNMANSIM
jgi:sodium-coupled neutral amino acid transporter 11